MSTVFALLYLVLMLFQLALIIRIVFDLIQMFARQWRPKGAALVSASVTYAVTDPPLRVVRRVIPPVRFGGIALDVAFLAVYFVTVILMAVFRQLA